MRRQISRKKPSLFRRIVRFVLSVVIVLLLIAAAFFGFFTASEYRPADEEMLEIENAQQASASLSEGDSLRIMTWNIGYGALGDNSDFFMDGGTGVMTADRDRVEANLAGMLAEIETEAPDVLLLQEVDVNSARSHHINEMAWFRDALTEYSSSWACNFRAVFVPYPIPPIGKVESGIMTLSSFPASDARRIQLPVPFSWPIRIVNLKRCLNVERIPLENSDRELVLINFHLEAYDSGEGKIAQTNMLREILREEAEKGNYIIAGGDLNQIFSNIDSSAYPVLENCWQPGIIDVDDFGEGWQFIMDTSVPSCRSLDRPYEGADHNNFQYYLIDGFIVSDNLEVKDYKAKDLQFVCSDHNPVLLEVTLTESQE